MKRPHALLALFAALALSACVNTALPPEEGEHRAAVAHLKQAEAKTLSAGQRAALYLEAAAEAEDLFGSPASGGAARRIYNKSAAELTVLLRDADQGGMWNRPLTLNSGTTTWRLRFAKGTRAGVWDPAFFTSFTPADEVKMKSIERKNSQDGVGGALVGVRKTNPLEPFSPLVGIAAPVTAVLDFKGHEATLILMDPTEKPKARVAGTERSLEADFSAPLSFYPHKSEYWNGIMGALRVDSYMKTTGLYMLQPYDPDRIPLIFVHGLISTARMWRNVINEIETDPELRGRFQCMVFAYPTGNPPAYSAMRFREELAKFNDLHPQAKNYVLVGHSMGGILSRLQTITMDREAWNVIGEDKAKRFFSNVKKNDLIERCMIFQANPHVDRVVFICTPHRGSEMAIGSLGELAMRMISLPVDLASTVTSSIGDSFSIITGNPHSLPNSVSGLSPRNPALKAFDSRPIEAPYHSIIGDRGKCDTPNSSDGVVKYWSSHLARAKSEKIVPGPHGACEMPETIEELKRLLHLHLKER
jgi:pimeloyl-ACP methyl ester carboxylesterase